MPTRQNARDLMHQWVQSESLRKHMYAVEAAMLHYAALNGLSPEEGEKWAIAGVLHDFDYEKYPDTEGHPWKGNEHLRERGYTEDILTAIMGHALYTNTPRETLMSKTLFAVDELCGFIMACAYVRPDRLNGLEPKSVKKKLKDKAFAAKVSREDIALGIQELGIDETQHIQNIITALQKIGPELGL